ncbi:MAG: hypothetical protein IT175_17820 [Acidobacteria bacterium]|nr:hypothetical protein [Acidobacteriota bacterium]
MSASSIYLPVRLMGVSLLLSTMVYSGIAQSKQTLAAAHIEANRAGRRGLDAYEAGKFDVFLSEMRKASAIRNDHPRFIYKLACALALNGKSNEALALLERLAAMGLSMPAGKDQDFRSLAGTARFRSVCDRLDANSIASGSSETAFTIPGRGLILEGLAFDPQTNSWFASSIRERKILRIDREGRVLVFADRTAGLWSVFGIAVDSRRRILWAATAAVPQTADVLEADTGKSALVGFDIATGKVVHSLESTDGKSHAIGDVLLAPNGDVYASDGTGGALFVARAGRGRLDVLIPEGQLVSPQGMALTPDGARLIVADYVLGLCSVDLTTRSVERVPSPDSVCLPGIDGVTVSGNDLIVIQNGIQPHRVARVRMGKGFRTVEGLDVLDGANPVFDEPTLGVAVNGWFHFIANSQWSKIDGKGEIQSADAFRDTLVRKLKL